MKEITDTRSILHETALSAPKTSGVYLWKDEQGTVIYVGKAKNLKNRLTSYFSGRKDVKTRILVSKAASIEYITTDNEYEALLLENTLIKQHSPRYNINLKDDKSYPVIRITNEPFPRLFKTRRIVQDGSRYFGPYPNVTALEAFIDILYRRYPLRHCKQLRKRTSPCMYYHIGRCAAPCCGRISEKAYMEFIEEICRLLEGDTDKTLQNLQNEMKKAAEALQFEKAARLRDGICAIRMLHEQNAVEDFDPEARDYIAYYAEGALVSFTVLQMRGGKLVGRDIYRTKSLNNEDELLSEFLIAYYGEENARMIPPRIFVPTEAGLRLTSQWFSHIRGARPTISVARGKRHEASMAMARLNAKEDIVRRMRERGDMPALEELRQLLDLPHVPSRIEGFDIAHLHGKFPIASMISFFNGNPDKKNYRYFRLKTTDGIIDDFASMREAASRRYTRLLNEQADMPDLILIDGGIGQVNAVHGVLEALNLDIPVIGLAKEDEQIYLPGNSTPVSLPRRSDALRLLQRVRDETHRFATSRNQRLRTKENTTLIFEELPGVGPVRARKLLDAFGTAEKLAASPAADIAAVLQCSVPQAEAVSEAAASVAERQRAKTVAPAAPQRGTDEAAPGISVSPAALASQAASAGYEDAPGSAGAEAAEGEAPYTRPSGNGTENT